MKLLRHLHVGHSGQPRHTKDDDRSIADAGRQRLAARNDRRRDVEQHCRDAKDRSAAVHCALRPDHAAERMRRGGAIACRLCPQPGDQTPCHRSSVAGVIMSDRQRSRARHRLAEARKSRSSPVNTGCLRCRRRQDRVGGRRFPVSRSHASVAVNPWRSSFRDAAMNSDATCQGITPSVVGFSRPRGARQM